jgi:hypothetical protein
MDDFFPTDSQIVVEGKYLSFSGNDNKEQEKNQS